MLTKTVTFSDEQIAMAKVNQCDLFAVVHVRLSEFDDKGTDSFNITGPLYPGLTVPFLNLTSQMLQSSKVVDPEQKARN